MNNAKKTELLDDAFEALRRLTETPDGSDMSLGHHDHGPHYVSAGLAWSFAHSTVRKIQREKNRERGAIEALKHIIGEIGGGGEPSEKTVLHWKEIAEKAIADSGE